MTIFRQEEFQKFLMFIIILFLDGLNIIKCFEEAQSCEILWDISNGRVLCFLCHKKTENWGNKGKK